MSVSYIAKPGGGGLSLSPHTVDGNTVEHWELGSDLLGDIGGATTDFDGGVHRKVYFPGAVSAVCTSAESTGTERLGGPKNVAGFYARQVTYACLLFCSELPGGSSFRHVWRYSKYDDPPASDLQVFMTMNPATGALRVGHVSTNALAFESDDLALTIPAGQWCHVVFTRSAAGNTGRVWVNGVGEDWSTTNPPDDVNVSPTTTELCLGNNANGTTRSPFSFYSLIVKNVEVNDADVAALLAQTGLPV